MLWRCQPVAVTISASITPLGRLMSSMICEPLLAARAFVVLATAGLLAFLPSAFVGVSGLLGS